MTGFLISADNCRDCAQVNSSRVCLHTGEGGPAQIGGIDINVENHTHNRTPLFPGEIDCEGVIRTKHDKVSQLLILGMNDTSLTFE